MSTPDHSRLTFFPVEDYLRPAPDYSLDRIDPHGNYEPGNLRWADKKVQAQNPVTGAITHTWQTVAGMESVPAAIEPLSVRELIASAHSLILLRIAAQSRTQARTSVKAPRMVDSSLRSASSSARMSGGVSGIAMSIS